MLEHRSLWSFSWEFKSHKQDVWDMYLDSAKRIFENFEGNFTVLLDFLDKPRRSQRTLAEIEQLPAVANTLQVESQGTIFLQVADIILGGVSYARNKRADIIKRKLSQEVLKTLNIKKATVDPVYVASYGNKIPQKESDVKFERIVSIQKIGRKQTYDLQIEGTHNFVGNNIVAHNTYINGSTGLGVNFVNTTTPSNGLAIQGNVGIGTTTANSNLVVVGNANIGSAYSGVTTPTNGLLVQGNVGIGTTGLGGNGAFNLDVWGTARITGATLINGVLTTSGNVGVGGSITGFGALSGLNVTGLANLAS